MDIGRMQPDDDGLDPELVERLLAAPADPPSDAPEGLAALLRAAASPTPSDAGLLPGELEAMAAFRSAHATHPAQPWRKRMLGKLATVKVAAAAIAGGVTLAAGGVAAAATGTLPAPAQSTVHDMLSNVGIHVPSADDGTQKVSDVNETESPEPTDEPTVAATETPAPDASEGADTHDNHGAEVSKVARSTSPGPGHGAAVSEVARQNHGHGTEHGNPDARASHSPEPTASAGVTESPEPTSSEAPENGQQPNSHASQGLAHQGG